MVKQGSKKVYEDKEVRIFNFYEPIYKDNKLIGYDSSKKTIVIIQKNPPFSCNIVK